jgi:hypothetical protein
MDQNSPNQTQPTDSFRDAMNILYLVVLTHSTCITPFIRTRFGTHANGLNAVLALFLIMFVAAESRDPAMYDYLVAWIVFLVFQRLVTFQAVLNRLHDHSSYRGFPWAAMLLPFVNTERAAKAVEPLLCLTAGVLLYLVSPALGLLIMSASVSMLILRLMEVGAVNSQVRHMRDAEIEHRIFSERFRGSRS